MFLRKHAIERLVGSRIAGKRLKSRIWTQLDKVEHKVMCAKSQLSKNRGEWKFAEITDVSTELRSSDRKNSPKKLHTQ